MADIPAINAPNPLLALIQLANFSLRESRSSKQGLTTRAAERQARSLSFVGHASSSTRERLVGTFFASSSSAWSRHFSHLPLSV